MLAVVGGTCLVAADGAGSACSSAPAQEPSRTELAIKMKAGKCVREAMDASPYVQCIGVTMRSSRCGAPGAMLLQAASTQAPPRSLLYPSDQNSAPFSMSNARNTERWQRSSCSQ